MEADDYVFPSTLNEQTRIFGLPLDECVIVLPLVLGGVTLGHTGAFLLSAVVLWLLIKHFKRGQGSSWLLNVAYWYLPTDIFKMVGTFKKVPDSSYRHWLR